MNKNSDLLNKLKLFSMKNLISKICKFIRDFCNGDGSINWEKFVQFNSGMGDG